MAGNRLFPPSDGRRKTRNDVIFVAVVLAAALLACGIYLLTRRTGEYAVVSINGEVYASYPLSEDITVELPTGSDGTGRNVLTIRDGKAFVADADCRDGICVHHQPICEVGDTIVCLPNRLVVEIYENG